MERRCPVAIIQLEKVSLAVNLEECDIVLVVWIVIRTEVVKLANREKNPRFQRCIQFRN